MGGQHQRPSAVTIESAPARVPAGVDRLDVLVNGQPVGDLHLRLCIACERAVIEHVRVGPADQPVSLNTPDENPGVSLKRSP